MKASAFPLKVGDESGWGGGGGECSRDPLLALTHPIRRSPSQEGKEVQEEEEREKGEDVPD